MTRQGPDRRTRQSAARAPRRDGAGSEPDVRRVVQARPAPQARWWLESSKGGAGRQGRPAKRATWCRLSMASRRRVGRPAVPRSGWSSRRQVKLEVWRQGAHASCRCGSAQADTRSNWPRPTTIRRSRPASWVSRCARSSAEKARAAGRAAASSCESAGGAAAARRRPPGDVLSGDRRPPVPRAQERIAEGGQVGRRCWCSAKARTLRAAAAGLKGCTPWTNGRSTTAGAPT